MIIIKKIILTSRVLCYASLFFVFIPEICSAAYNAYKIDIQEAYYERRGSLWCSKDVTAEFKQKLPELCDGQDGQSLLNNCNFNVTMDNCSFYSRFLYSGRLSIKYNCLRREQWGDGSYQSDDWHNVGDVRVATAYIGEQITLSCNEELSVDNVLRTNRDESISWAAIKFAVPGMLVGIIVKVIEHYASGGADDSS